MKIISVLSLITIHISHIMGVPLLHLSMREKGNYFHLKVSCVMPGITRYEHSSLADDRGDLHSRLRRRVVPEPRQCNQGEVPS
jgi:hypothetical protein